jgi:hypothetical protein
MVIMMEETAVLRDILAPRLAELCPGALEHFDAAWAKAQRQAAIAQMDNVAM